VDARGMTPGAKEWKYGNESSTGQFG